MTQEDQTEETIEERKPDWHSGKLLMPEIVQQNSQYDGQEEKSQICQRDS